MRAIIKSLSADTEDVNKFSPANPECFWLSLLVRIGPEGGAGADDFDLFVCTPDWLKQHVHGAMWGRHYIIVQDFNLDCIRSLVQETLGGIEGESWSELAPRIARFLSWEFEDYKM